MKKIKKINKIILILFLIFILFIVNLSHLNLDENILNNIKIDKSITKSKPLKLDINENLTSDIKVIFCPSNECYQLYLDTIKNADSEILCAFYDLDFLNLSEKLKEKSNNGIKVSIITDYDYINEIGITNLKNSNIEISSDKNRKTKYDNYMHDKFCVIDSKIIITGSTNPTDNGFLKNNNNMLRIDSKYLATNYKNEFLEMKSGNFGYNKHSTLEYNNLNLSYENNSYITSSYMCPQDNCEQKVLEILNNSKTSIDFAAFSFTNENIENILTEKSKAGIKIRGIIEKRSWNIQSSSANSLSKFFFVINDTNKNTMHHKFFVVDNKYVITGSMNPTSAGVNYNDENILIIENENIANLYENEFEKLIK